jgi:hypothetical protein
METLNSGTKMDYYITGIIQPILMETLLVNGTRMDVFTEMVIILHMFRLIVLESGTRMDYYIGKGVPLLLIEVVRNGTRTVQEWYKNGKREESRLI